MKFITLAEAVAEFVHDGDRVALEGFTHLIPFAAGHEIIQQGRRGLALARMMVSEQTGLPIRFAAQVEETAPPSPGDLEVLRDLQARTQRAHGAMIGDA